MRKPALNLLPPPPHFCFQLAAKYGFLAPLPLATGEDEGGTDMPRFRTNAVVAALLAVSAQPGAALAKEAAVQGAASPAQPSAIQSPRDVASGQASGVREGGVNDTTFQSASGSAQPGAALVNNENVSGARGTATASQGSNWVGGTDDGQSMRRKPPRKKGRKARRMHKP